MSQIMEKFDVLKELNDEFKKRVKILYVFKDYIYQNNVLIVTKDDKTYAFGFNSHNQLGFGHNEVVNDIKIVKELCDQQIIDFANGWYHCIARNSRGKVYSWGWNRWGELGIGSQDESFHKPKLNQYLNNEFVIDISCGALHSLVLTNCGEVYACGSNYWGQIGNGCNGDQLTPIKVKGFNNERVVMISCGKCHSMALTECGHVYSWGSNEFGQLGIGNTVDSNEPKFVAVIDENKCTVFIEKISCGFGHSLLLSSDGNIYAFGWNKSGELGNQKEKNESSPHRIKIETKFIDISSHWNISIALSQNGIYYNWGQCGEERIRKPEPTNFESFVEIYAKYLKITNKAINFEEQNPTKEQQDKYVNEFSQKGKEVSSGSFGTVFKVMHKNSKKIYAIKRIALNEEELEKAFKELNLMKGLKSRFVVEYIDSWIEKNASLSHDPKKAVLLHIQMEFCCQTLKEVIEYLLKELRGNAQQMIKSLCYFICCELLTEIIECVHYLHGRNIIHRDLKPANILITNGINGRFIKLGDFGLSVIHEFIDQSHTQDSGTPKYMAPEVVISRKYDTKADIYSLGIIVENLFFLKYNLFSNGNQIISNEKLLKLKESYDMMTALDENRRPECKQILAKKYFWYLNPFDSSLKGFIHESLALNSAEKSFSQHFIQQKFKYYSNNFEESYNQEMKKNKYKQEFEEIDLISIGSYGIVCKAKNRKSCEFFAVKKIPFNEELRDLVMKEIESLPNLKSALVVKLESVWIEDNYLKIDDYKTDKHTESIGIPDIFKPLLLHIQMEFCLMTLRDVINKSNNELKQYQSEVMKPLGYYISSQLFEEILESVDYLHKQNVIHRDLKPNNILITDGMNGRFVKLSDFGLSTIHEFCGHLRTKYEEKQIYSAPEVMKSRKYDTKADIYSLGVILQELFNIDINEPIGEGSKLEDKYLNLFKLTKRMTATQMKKRPNCDEILPQKHLWSLNLTELQNDSEFKSKEIQFSDNSFHSHFVKMKSRKSIKS